MILAGDIGGTNTRLAAFAIARGKWVMRERRDFRNAESKNFESIVRQFTGSLAHEFDVACFGVAGPVRGGRASLTNLNWSFDEKQLARKFKIRRVALINDLVAHAEGTNALTSRDLITLHRGKPIARGNRAIIAPGTGLGEAGLVFDERSKDYRAFASEGGHGDFSPKDDREIALMKFTWKKLGRCSWEDVLCGPGLRNIYDFLAAPGEFHIDSAQGDCEPTPAEISRAGSSDECPASRAAVEMLASFYGSEAGNLALKVLATGGIYIGGGIAPHIAKFLRDSRVRESFISKGPKNIRQLLSAIPIYLIKSNDGALMGAAHYASRL